MVTKRMLENKTIKEMYSEVFREKYKRSVISKFSWSGCRILFVTKVGFFWAYVEMTYDQACMLYRSANHINVH